MIRLLIDEDLHHGIVRGLRRQRSDLSLLRVQDTAVAGASDSEVLEFAAQCGMVLVTHDANTMTTHAKSRVSQGKSMPGLIVIRQQLSIGQAISDLQLVADLVDEGEWEGQIHFFPL